MTQSRIPRASSTSSRLGRRGASLCALVVLAASPLTGYCSNPDLASASELPPSEYSSTSLKASSIQFGFDNTSQISQHGSRQTAAIGQVGADNTASITQTGINDLAVAAQYGTANDAKFIQTRNNDTAIANQYGNSNSALVYQGVSNATAIVNQIGDQNAANVMQTRPSAVPVIVNSIGNGMTVNVIR